MGPLTTQTKLLQQTGLYATHYLQMPATASKLKLLPYAPPPPEKSHTYNKQYNNAHTAIILEHATVLATQLAILGDQPQNSTPSVQTT